MRQIIDKHYDNDDFKFVFSEGSNSTVLVDVQTLGDADTSLTGYTAKIYYYDHVDDTTFYEIDSDSIDAATGRFTFNVQPADLAIEGAYPAEIVILDGSSNPFVHAYGSVIIKDSILQAGTTALTTGPVINYAIFSSYQNVSTSGPYRAGTNITFSSNADGSVNIDGSAGGSGDVSAALSLTDNAIVRGDGGVKGVQTSGILIDDSDNISGAVDIASASLNIGTAPSGLDNVNIDGAVDITHTSAANDDHAFEIDIDAAGFGDVKAVDIAYTTGAIATGDEEAVILVNIDESAATGGDVTGMEIIATEGAADNVFGVFAGVGVSPIEHLSGTFANADTVLNNAVDVTTDVSDGGAGNISIFVNDNDTVTVGSSAKFEELEFLMSTTASGSGIQPTFEFSTGVGTWSTFVPVDGTNGMRNNGVVVWLDGDVPTWAPGTGSEYLIRVTRTRNSLGTTPIATKIKVAAAVEYKWDKNADLTINSVNIGGKDFTSGSASLVSGQDFLVVTGLGLAAAPTSVTVSVSKPTSGDYNIFATVVEDTITTDGFRVELSATPDNGNYKLKYITL
jgi:hypothetical protein